MSVLLDEYRRHAVEHGRQTIEGDVDATNLAYDHLQEAFNAIMRMGGGHHIFRFYDDADLWVQAWAAAHTLRIDHDRALRKLRELESAKIPHVTTDAKYIIQDWKIGKTVTQTTITPQPKKQSMTPALSSRTICFRQRRNTKFGAARHPSHSHSLAGFAERKGLLLASFQKPQIARSAGEADAVEIFADRHRVFAAGAEQLADLADRDSLAVRQPRGERRP
jgi:hypothetical protein